MEPGLRATNTIDTVATDLNGNIDWFYNSIANNFKSTAVSLVPGGTVLLEGLLPGQVTTNQTVVREIDLAGDTLRETNINAVNAELAALGDHPISDFNHDAQRLPNGDTAVISTTTRVINVNGKPTTYDGDDIIVLDKNFQVSWAWNAFNWLNTNRLPTLGEGPGDWLHANSVALSPEDGDLLFSASCSKIGYSRLITPMAPATATSYGR